MNDILQALADPHMRHAIYVHTPIVTLMLAPFLLIALACTGFRSRTLQLVSLAILLLASAGAGLAAGAGEDAEHSLHEHRLVNSERAAEALERHEELGEGGWRWPLIPAVALVVSMALQKKKVWRAALGSIALITSVMAAGWVATTASAGGDLVYRHGLGAPSPLAAEHAPASPAPLPASTGHDDDDD